MKDIQEMSYEEIAQALRIPIGTVRSRLHRARLELAQLLGVLTFEADTSEGNNGHTSVRSGGNRNRSGSEESRVADADSH
jgi:RNA polymerase sigma-70 factor (ECF subfamily)